MSDKPCSVTSKRPERDYFGAVLDYFSLMAGLALGNTEKNHEHS